MLNVRILKFREPKLEIVRAESNGWFTKMTKQTAWDRVDERPRNTILALRMGGPQLKTFRIGPIAAGRFRRRRDGSREKRHFSEDDRLLG